MPELGMIASKCNCETHCAKGVEPMGDCVCRLPGETVTAYCDVCDPTHQRFTWHNNGSCISCVRRVRDEAKERAARRHEQVMASPPNPVQLPAMEDADYRAVEKQQPVDVAMKIILRVNEQDLVLTSKLDDVVEVIRLVKTL